MIWYDTIVECVLKGTVACSDWASEYSICFHPISIKMTKKTTHLPSTAATGIMILNNYVFCNLEYVWPCLTSSFQTVSQLFFKPLAPKSRYFGKLFGLHAVRGPEEMMLQEGDLPRFDGLHQHLHRGRHVGARGALAPVDAPQDAQGRGTRTAPTKFAKARVVEVRFHEKLAKIWQNVQNIWVKMGQV